MQAATLSKACAAMLGQPACAMRTVEMKRMTAGHYVNTTQQQANQVPELTDTGTGQQNNGTAEPERVARRL